MKHFCIFQEQKPANRLSLATEQFCTPIYLWTRLHEHMNQYLQQICDKPIIKCKITNYNYTHKHKRKLQKHKNATSRQSNMLTSWTPNQQTFSEDSRCEKHNTNSHLLLIRLLLLNPCGSFSGQVCTATTKPFLSLSHSHTWLFQPVFPSTTAATTNSDGPLFLIWPPANI